MQESIKKKKREQLLEESLPQFEQFIESRESYIKALEQTIDVLKQENVQYTQNNLAIRSSIDELVATQRLSNIISTATDPELIVGTLIELTRQVIPVIESNIFLFESSSSNKNQESLRQLGQPRVSTGVAERKGAVLWEVSCVSRR